MFCFRACLRGGGLYINRRIRMPRIVTPGKTGNGSAVSAPYGIRPEKTRFKPKKRKYSKFLKILVLVLIFLHFDTVLRSLSRIGAKFGKFAYTDKGFDYRINQVHIRHTNYSYRLGYYFRHYSKIVIYGIWGFIRLTVPIVAPIAGVVILVISVWAFNTYAIALEVTVGSESLGYVGSEQEFNSIQQQVEQRISDDGGDEEYVTEAIPFLRLSVVKKDEITEDSTVVKTLYDSYREYIGQSYGFFIDGKLIGTSKTEDDFNAVLSVVAKPYLSGEEGEDYLILNSIETVRNEYPRDYEKTAEELLALFTMSSEKTVYTVKKGDTLESIAKKYSLGVPVLRLLNDNISGDYLSVGMTLNVGAPYAQLSIQTTRTVTYTEIIPYDTKYIYSDSLYESVTETKQSGINGTYEVSAEIKSVNGVEISRDVVTKKKTRDAIAKQVLVGTKTIAPSGTFIWPVSLDGYQFVSSGFGSRTLYGVYDFHRGYDIACEYGTKIFAADAGTVIKIDYQTNGLGNYIVIDHGNGIYSYYGHCSSIDKKMYVGLKVYQGQTIAYVGSTGNSTGNHVHFALFNTATGEYFDPEPYLPKP